MKRYGSEYYLKQSSENAEIRRLQKELKRVTEERDLLKKLQSTSQATLSKIRLYSGTSSWLFDSSIMTII